MALTQAVFEFLDGCGPRCFKKYACSCQDSKQTETKLPQPKKFPSSQSLATHSYLIYPKEPQ